MTREDARRAVADIERGNLKQWPGSGRFAVDCGALDDRAQNWRGVDGGSLGTARPTQNWHTADGGSLGTARPTRIGINYG